MDSNNQCITLNLSQSTATTIACRNIRLFWHFSIPFSRHYYALLIATPVHSWQLKGSIWFWIVKQRFCLLFQILSNFAETSYFQRFPIYLVQFGRQSLTGMLNVVWDQVCCLLRVNIADAFTPPNHQPPTKNANLLWPHRSHHLFPIRPCFVYTPSFTTKQLSSLKWWFQWFVFAQLELHFVFFTFDIAIQIAYASNYSAIVDVLCSTLVPFAMSFEQIVECKRKKIVRDSFLCYCIMWLASGMLNIHTHTITDRGRSRMFKMLCQFNVINHHSWSWVLHI